MLSPANGGPSATTSVGSDRVIGQQDGDSDCESLDETTILMVNDGLVASNPEASYMETTDEKSTCPSFRMEISSSGSSTATFGSIGKLSLDGELRQSRPQEAEAGKAGLRDIGKGYVTETRRRIRRTCTTKLLKRRLPFLKWLPKYSVQSAFYDSMAGFTVALTAIPQGIAYAAVAGLPLEFGLYTAFAGPFVYAIFGSVSQITVGPTAVMAIMTHAYAQKGGVPYAIVLSFMAGCFELVAGLLNLGFLMEFISGPVISGFVAACATTVIFSQFKSILGLTFRGSSFYQVLPGIFTNLQDVKLWDTVLGVSFIVFILLVKNVNVMKKYFARTCCLHRPHVDKALWFLATCRNAVAVILGCTLAFVLDLYDYAPFNLTGTIKSGIPTFQLPPFSFERPVTPMVALNASANWTDIIANQTYELVTFDKILSDLGASLVLVPVVAILEQIAIAKAFSNGGKTDSTQEMIAVGLGSIFCSFFGCFPLTASFSRSSVLAASGGKTQLASLFNGCVILLALAFLMPTFYYIPKSVLAAVIITAVYPMIEFHEYFHMWKSRRIELIPLLVTYFCCLFINMEYGIITGALLHLLLLVHQASSSRSICLRSKTDEEERIVFQVDRNLYFPTVERFRNTLSKASSGKSAKTTIVLDMSRVTEIDFTTLRMIQAMLLNWDKKGYQYSFINVNDKLKTILENTLPSTVPILGSFLSSAETQISFTNVPAEEFCSPLKTE